MIEHDVFISYSARDKAVADAVCATLEGRNVRCWIAPRDVLPGERWASALVDAIRQSRVFVLVFSDGANRSQDVLNELQAAVDRSIPIIPFRIEDVPPSKEVGYYINTIHWLDALTPPLEKHLQTLGDRVHALLATDDEWAQLAEKDTRKLEAEADERVAEAIRLRSAVALSSSVDVEVAVRSRLALVAQKTHVYSDILAEVYRVRNRFREALDSLQDATEDHPPLDWKESYLALTARLEHYRAFYDQGLWEMLHSYKHVLFDALKIYQSVRESVLHASPNQEVSRGQSLQDLESFYRDIDKRYDARGQSLPKLESFYRDIDKRYDAIVTRIQEYIEQSK